MLKSDIKVIFAGSVIADVDDLVASGSLQLSLDLGGELTPLVASDYATIIDSGNSSGSFSLPLVNDFATPTEALIFYAQQQAQWSKTIIAPLTIGLTTYPMASITNYSAELGAAPNGEARMTRTFSFIFSNHAD